MVSYSTDLEIFCAVPIYPFLLPIRVMADLFAVSIVFPFLECHVVEIIQDYTVTFSDWLLSLSTMHLSFFHVFSRLDSSFFYL